MQRTLLRIAEECVRRNHEVHILTGGWLGDKPDTITVIEFDTRAMTNVWSNDVLARKVQAHITGKDYDCLVGFTKLPDLDIYYAGDPCYAARVDETKSVLYKMLPRYHGFKRQEAAVFARHKKTEILLIAHKEKDKFIQYYDTEPHRFHLLPPGIYKQRFANQPLDQENKKRLRQQFGFTDQEHIVLTVGSRFKTKGLDRSLQALAALSADILKKTRLVVVGGDKAEPYQRLAKRLGVSDQVVFTGAQRNIARYYAAADVLIHPPYSENTGTILIEAMLCALPILTTANCGFAFHVEKADAGRVCPDPFDQHDLNQGLLDMLQQDRHMWQKNGPDYCSHTDLYSLIDKAVDITIECARKKESQ